MTTVNTNTTQINDNIGTSSDTTANTTVIGRLANIQQQSILANTALGTTSSEQNSNDVIGKLKQIQLNGANTYTQVTDIKDTTDVNYIFINEISKLVDRIIVKLQELQMKRW